MRIIEIFHSVQGEGLESGVRTSFVRTARCNLRCTWCDTKYSFGPGMEKSIPAILKEVKAHKTRHVCLTGGEPLLQADSVRLVEEFSRKGYHTVIETGGSLDIGPYLHIPRTTISLDVKAPSSRMQDRMRWENLKLLRPHDTVKIVVADRRDYLYARTFLKSHRLPCHVVLQPAWGTPPGALADWVLKDHLDVRVLLQMHKVLWGDVPGR